MIRVDNLYQEDEYGLRFAYIIDNNVYDALNLESFGFDEDELNDLMSEPPFVFDLDPLGSKPIGVILRNNRADYDFEFALIYQEVNNQLMSLIQRPDRYDEIVSINILNVPLPGGQQIEDNFQELNLREPSEEIMIELRDDLNARRQERVSPLSAREEWIVSELPSGYEELTSQLEDLSSKYESLLLSHEALIKQIYGLPVETPEFLILNNLKVNFIPFSQVNTIQIERYLIEPLLQVWASPPNKIITIFDINGMTYLVKARFDPVSNQIFPPI